MHKNNYARVKKSKLFENMIFLDYKFNTK